MKQSRLIINLRGNSTQKLKIFGLLILCLITILTILGYFVVQFPLAFLLPIGLGITIIILLNPFIGFLILVVGVIFPSGIPILNSPFTVMKTVGVLTLIGWAARSSFCKKVEFMIDSHLIVVVLFTLWTLFSVIWARYGEETIQATESLIWTVVFYLLVLVMVDSRSKYERVVYVLIFSGVVASLAGFVLPPEPATGRLGGIVGSSNYLAPGLAVSATMSMGLVLHEKKRWIRFLSGVALFIVMMGLFYTMSRRGLAGMVLSLLFLLFLEREKRSYYIVWVMAVAIAGFFFAPRELWERFSVELIQTNVRRYLWRTAFIVFLQHPLTGIGFGNFMWGFSEFKWLTRVPLDAYWYRQAPVAVVHNTYLTIMAELGIVGIAFFAVIIFLSLKRLFVVRSIFKSKKNMSMYHLTNATIASFGGLLTVALFGSHLLSLNLWLLLGLSVALNRLAIKSAEEKTINAPLVGYTRP